MKKFLLIFLSQLLVVLTLLGIATWVYFGIQSEHGLLSNSTLLKLAEENVLGNPPYKGTCPRILYASEVDYPHGRDEKNVATFIFYPLPSHGDHCRPVQITMSRYTGEAWLTFLEKSQ